MTGITIVGSGHFAPGKPVSNQALARVMDTNDDWIYQRTGIRQRHFAEHGQGASDLAVEAARLAIADAKIEATDIDYIVFATMTPDYLFPGSGGLLGAKLDIPGVPALDIRQQCAAVPFALQVANGLVRSGAAKTLLLVGAEAHAGFMPWSHWDTLRELPNAASPDEDAWERATRHRGMAILFGDGAGAWVMQAASAPSAGLIDVCVQSDGRHFDQIYIEEGGFRQLPYLSETILNQDGHIPKMQGRDLFKLAVTKLPEAIRSLCARHNLDLDNIDWFIGHQANDRINQAVRNALGVPTEKVPSNIERFGNTSGATIPILTDELRRSGTLKEGQLVCFFALGAGLHWGAALMRM